MQLTAKEVLEQGLSSIPKKFKNNITSVMTDIEKIMERALKTEKDNERNTKMRWRVTKTVQNWDELRRLDKELGRCFDADTMSYKNPEDEQIFIASNSIYSYRFGIRSNDSKLVASKRFRCPTCGEFESGMAGEICPYCGSETVYTYDVRGYFKLNGYKVFNPHWLNLFLSNLNKTTNKKVLTQALFHYVSKKKKIAPNILDLQDKEVLKEWIKTYAHPNYVKTFLDDIDAAMSEYIPIMSKDFRYYSVSYRMDGKATVNTHTLNRFYIIINNNVEDINKMASKEQYATPTALINALSNISNRLLDILAECTKMLGDGKESMIRGKIGGRRKGHSGRLVVEGLKHPRVDACTIPYTYFGEWFIDYHRELFVKHGMDPHGEVRMKNNFPNRKDRIVMAKVLQDLKEQNLNYLLIYRAPCIYIGSIISVEIIGLTHGDDTIRINDTSLDFCLHGDKNIYICLNITMTPTV